MEYVLPGRGQGAESPAVEAVHKGDYVVATLAVFVKAVFTGDLYRTFVGFSAGVAEKHIGVTRSIAQCLSEVRLYFCVIVI